MSRFCGNDPSVRAATVGRAVADTGWRDAVGNTRGLHELDDAPRRDLAGIVGAGAANVRAEALGGLEVALGAGLGGEAEHRRRVDDDRHAVGHHGLGVGVAVGAGNRGPARTPNRTCRGAGGSRNCRRRWRPGSRRTSGPPEGLVIIGHRPRIETSRSLPETQARRGSMPKPLHGLAPLPGRECRRAGSAALPAASGVGSRRGIAARIRGRGSTRRRSAGRMTLRGRVRVVPGQISSFVGFVVGLIAVRHFRG